jgi:mannose-6-phosphate isomerase-like protein (cupin superfamily)
MFQTVHAPSYDERAPDGSTVYPLVRTERASTGLIHLAPGETSATVKHRTVEEIWYVLAGRGELWRSLDGANETVSLTPGTCVTIPAGASFQFRAGHADALEILMFTSPPWPGPEEAEPVGGRWFPSPHR